MPHVAEPTPPAALDPRTSPCELGPPEAFSDESALDDYFELWPRQASAGGNGSPCSMHDSAIFRASPWAISVASATLRPSATKPGTSTLVARNRPPASSST